MHRQFHPSHALHYIPAETGTLLDVGCNVGAALFDALELGVKRAIGVDLNPHALEVAALRLEGRAQLHHASADELPLADGDIDVALMLEVLEHIPADLRVSAISELHRVVRPGGRLIVTTPWAGLFAGLDPANQRLRFPRIFRVAERLAGGVGRERGYEGQKHGIVVHHHFALAELESLFSGRFAIELIRHRGALIAPVCSWLQFPFYRRKRTDHPLARILRWLEDRDLERNWGPRLGYDVLIVARRS